MKFSVGKSALMPFDDKAIKFMAGRRVGEVLYVTALDENEQKYRSFVFMVLAKSAEAAKLTLDEFRDRLQIKAGRCPVYRVDGVNIARVKSMNVGTMKHDDLKDFWDDAVPLIKEMLPSFHPEDAAEIDQLLGGDNAER
jgi:hypothetical protein